MPTKEPLVPSVDLSWTGELCMIIFFICFEGIPRLCDNLQNISMATVLLSPEACSTPSPFNNVCFGTPPFESIPASPFSDIKTEKSFWNRLSKRAKHLLSDTTGGSNITPDSSPLSSNEVFCSTEQSNIHSGGGAESHPCGKKVRAEDSKLLQKGLDAVASSLVRLRETLGSAVEEGANLAEIKLSELFPVKADVPSPQGERRPSAGEDAGRQSVSARLKDSRNVAMAMMAKAKSLQRELKSIRADLCFVRERCAFLEEENRRLRDGGTKCLRPEEDDLVRLQLEALLAEKARLAQENANYARENEYLHQLVEYHQLTSQDVAVFDDSMAAVCLDFSSPSSSPHLIKRGRDSDDVDLKTPIRNVVKFACPLRPYDDDDVDDKLT